VRRGATLLLETDRVLIYVDDEDAPDFTSSELEAWAAWWEVVERNATNLSGPLTDVDGNGKFILLFTSVLGPRAPGLGNVWDIWSSPPGLTPDLVCTSSSAANAADMIQLHPPVGLTDLGGRPLPRDVAWEVVKAAMAQVLQRMVADYGCVLCANKASNRCDACVREASMMRGQMSLAKTRAGSGNHVASLRALAAPALFSRAGPGGGFGGYPSAHLFSWEEGSPASRAAMDSFLLYLADRLGDGFVAALYDRVATASQLEALTGIPLPLAAALWTGALLFSNEPASPWRGFDYTGPDWTPLHEKFLPFEYAPLSAGVPVTATLPQTGFDAYVTGAAGPGGGTVTVTSGEALRPYVVAIPFRGSLP
jgi:hypothetical protein